MRGKSVKNTLREETLAGINFRVFRVFWPFSRKFMPFKFFHAKKIVFKAKFSVTFVKIGTTDDGSDSDWVEEN